MIRDLTKSMFSFSWGMSLFAVTQLINSMTPEKATGAFNAVTRATEAQLSDVLKGAFKAGDQLQRGVVDMTFGMLTLDALNPSKMMKMASDVMQQTTGASGQSAQARPTGSQEQATGWGPIPPTGAKMKMASDVMQQTTGASGQSAQARPTGLQEQATGWGPIRPADAK